MSTFFDKQLKKVLPCILIMIISCCMFVINAGAETIIHLEEKKLFGSPTVSTSSMARAADVDALSDYLRAELIKCPESVDISSFNLEYEDTNTAILSNIIYYESPELFHINGLSMSVSGGIIRTVIPRYGYSAQEYTKMYNDCLNQVNVILDGIADNSKLNDVQKALLIHDRLAVHCEYDISNYNNKNIPDESYTMYGALAKGVAVCQGYSESYMYLLEKVGIENRLCSSDALFHVWNIATINGKEYHIDVTWDDPIMDITGRVLHTNFLRSSNGIYATGHDASDYDRSPTDTTYDNYFWQDSETAFQSVGNEIYYIDNEAGALKKYSNKSTVVEYTDTWPASTDGYYWVGNFSRLSSDGTNLYYNLSDAVYKYTISTGKSEKIWSPDLSAGALFRIYGFMYKDGYLICDINDTPDFELNDKKNNQQKYLYHNQSSSTLESISISASPKKTDYYIGDELNTDGLQLKLNYSNGSSKYITSGFTVSGFSSSSSGSKKVTVSYNGFTATFNVNVKTPGIVLDASSVKIDLRDYCVLTATTDPKNVSVKWSSSNNNVATVSNGEVESVSVGTAVVTAEFSYNGYTYKATCNITVECKHSSVQTIKGTAATCTENGLTDGKKCSVCGTVTVAQQTIAKKGHTEVTVAGKAATCTETGLTDGKKCSACGTVTVAQQTIAKKGHTEVTVAGKAATCTETGLTEGKKCSVCGTVITEQKTINALGHKETTREENRKEASCKNNGSYDLVTYCSVCGVVIKTETKTIPATNDHVYATETERVASTCKTAGYVVMSCGCGETKKETLRLDANNHENIVVLDAVDPTCTATGLTEGKKCSACGTVTVAQQTIAKKGHTEVTVAGKEATCTETGLTDGKKCSVCGTVIAEQKTINALGHKETTREENRKEASCKNNGSYDLVTYCSVCGVVIKTETKTIPATNDHVYATETERVASTCKTAGYVVMSCGCGETKKETLRLDANNHENIVVLDAVDPTCTATGLTEGKKCSACGTVTVEQREIAKKRHWTVRIPGKAPTETESGLTDGEKCMICGTITKEQQIIPELNHNHDYTSTVTKPTCTENGYTTYTCRCGDEYKDNYADALGHITEIIKGKDATCTEPGFTDGEKCSVCDEILVVQEEIKAIGHTEETTPGKKATCTETGLTDGKKCFVCDEILVQQEEIAKTGHIETAIDAKAPTCTENGSEAGIKCSVCDEILVYPEEIEKLGHTPGEWETVKAPQVGKDGLMQQKCAVCGEAVEEKIIPALDDKPTNTFGDANNDGNITAADARLVLRMSAKIDAYSDAQIAYLDLNKDTKITAADARILLRISAKIESIESYIK